MERVPSLSERADYDPTLPQASLALLVRVYPEHIDHPSLDVFHGGSRRLVSLTDRLA